VSLKKQASRPADPEKRRQFLVLLLSRVALISALFGSTIFFNMRSSLSFLSASQVMLYGIVAVVYLGTAASLLWLKFGRLNIRLHVQGQIVFDVLVAALLVYLTGGVESPFCFFLALPVIVTTVFSSRRGTFLTAGLSCLFLGAVFILENRGILPVMPEGRVGPPPATGRIVYLLMLNYTAYFAIAWLSGTLGEQLKRTGRKLEKTEIDLERIEALNRDIVQSLLSGLMVVDPRGKVSLLNPVAGRILGVDPERVTQQAASEIFPPLADALVSLAKDGGLRSEVELFRGKDGARIPVGVTLSVLRNKNGEDAGTLVHMQDLTERRQLEASVRRAEKLAALGKMAASMAHEIRNPLASMSGAVQVLSKTPSFADADRRLADIILRETRRLDVLLTDFLAYARPREPRLQQCDLRKLVEETVSVYLESNGGDPKSPRLTTELAELSARVDADQIRQLLWNLLKNAVEAAPGQVMVRLRPAAGDDGERRAVIEVTDDGPEIAADIRDRIFEPFFTTKEEGSGLGLATVNRIVGAHGGGVSLDSPAGRGNRFVVSLPGVIDE
jgi:two-component system, NtrC family, sensor histidine kinase PilS